MEGTDTSKQKNLHGIRIRTINYAMIVAACIIYISLLYITVQVSLKCSDTLSATDMHIACEEDARLVSEASDYLTEQVRLYAVNGDVQYMDAYFEELNVTKRRETALAQLKERGAGAEATNYLSMALESSDTLAQEEIYAMRLVSEAYGYEIETLPAEVQDIILKEEDRSLNPDEMLTKGRAMVFDTSYQNSKSQIMENISYFTDEVVKGTQQKQAESADELERAVSIQRICISFLFILNIVTFIMIIRLIVKPLQIYIKCIKEGKTLEISGSYEFRYLALTYNDIYELNAANEEMLLYRAEHDPLTGVINRGGFDKLRKLLKAKPEPMAFMLFDVDKFKNVNDTYGHEVGDQVLKRVAAIAEENFRSNDFVARIGGDEFAVIMTASTPESKSIIRQKIETMNADLMNPSDDLPPVSLSVGVAFSELGFGDELYSRADKALYRVKENGRCGHAFYDEL